MPQTMPARSRRAKAGTRRVPNGFNSGLSKTIIEQWRRQRPDACSSAFKMGLLTTRLSILLDQIRDATLLECEDIGEASHELLYALRRPGPPYAQRPTDLYRLLGLTSGAVTYTVRTLSDRGLVKVIDDPADRRGSLVQLTAKGLKLCDRRVSAMSAALEKACEARSAQDQADILRGLMSLVDAWESHVDALNGPAT